MIIPIVLPVVTLRDQPAGPHVLHRRGPDGGMVARPCTIRRAYGILLGEVRP